MSLFLVDRAKVFLNIKKKESSKPYQCQLSYQCHRLLLFQVDHHHKSAKLYSLLVRQKHRQLQHIKQGIAAIKDKKTYCFTSDA